MVDWLTGETAAWGEDEEAGDGHWLPGAIPGQDWEPREAIQTTGLQPEGGVPGRPQTEAHWQGQPHSGQVWEGPCPSVNIDYIYFFLINHNTCMIYILTSLPSL